MVEVGVVWSSLWSLAIIVDLYLSLSCSKDRGCKLQPLSRKIMTIFATMIDRGKFPSLPLFLCEAETTFWDFGLHLKHRTLGTRFSVSVSRTNTRKTKEQHKCFHRIRFCSSALFFP